MLDSISRERLQPSLLDRLTDEIKGIESDIGRLRQRVLPQTGRGRREALAGLLDPDATGLPTRGGVAPFAALGPVVVEQVKRLVGLEQRRQRRAPITLRAVDRTPAGLACCAISLAAQHPQPALA